MLRCSNLVAIALAGFLANCCVLAAQTAPPGYKLHLWTRDASAIVNQGQPLVIMVSLKNVSSQLINVEEDKSLSGDANYKLSVLDINGKEPPLTAYHRLLRGKPDPKDPMMILNSDSILVPLGPRGTLTNPIDLSKLYSLKPGQYTVQARREYDSQGDSVASDSLTVTITSR